MKRVKNTNTNYLKLKDFITKLPQNKSIIIREIILSYLFSQYTKSNFQFLIKTNNNLGDDIKSIINLFKKLNIKRYFNLNIFLFIKKLIFKSIKINIKESGFVARFTFIFIPFYLIYLNPLKLNKITIIGEKTLKNRKLFIEDELLNILQILYPNIKIEFLKNNDFLPVSFSLIKNENYFQKINNNDDFNKKNFIINFHLKKTSQNITSLLLILPFILIFNNNYKNNDYIEVEINNIKSFSYILMTLFLLAKNKINVFIKQNNEYLLINESILNKFYKELIINNFEEKIENKNINDFILRLRFIKSDILENYNQNIKYFKNKNFNFLNKIQKIDLSILSFFFILFHINNDNAILKNIFNNNFFEILKNPEKNNFFYYQGDYLFFIFYESLNKNNKKFFYFNFENCPDIVFPCVIFTIIKKKKVYFYGIERLKYKESNRIFSLIEEFNKLNVRLFYNEEKDFLFLDGNEAYKQIIKKRKENINKTIQINSHGDHRIVYTYSTLGYIFDLNIKIINKNCVTKTFPDFFKILKLIKIVDKK